MKAKNHYGSQLKVASDGLRCNGQPFKFLVVKATTKGNLRKDLLSKLQQNQLDAVKKVNRLFYKYLGPGHNTVTSKNSKGHYVIRMILIDDMDIQTKWFRRLVRLIKFVGRTDGIAVDVEVLPGDLQQKFLNCTVLSSTDCGYIRAIYLYYLSKLSPNGVIATGQKNICE